MNTNKNDTKWQTDELQKIAGKDDLKISPFRQAGATYGTPTWIWNVAVNGDLYVCVYNKQGSRWYQAALQQKAERIHAVGMVKEVAFEPVDEAAINNLIDDAYRDKYKKSLYLDSIISEKARASTI